MKRRMRKQLMALLVALLLTGSAGVLAGSFNFAFALALETGYSGTEVKNDSSTAGYVMQTSGEDAYSNTIIYNIVQANTNEVVSGSVGMSPYDRSLHYMTYTAGWAPIRTTVKLRGVCHIGTYGCSASGVWSANG